MSVNDFKKRPRLTIEVTFECSGAFNPFAGGGTMNWELTGSVSGSTGQPNVTEEQITCGTNLGYDTIFGFFVISPGSTGGSSGSVDTGVLPYKFPPTIKVADNFWFSGDEWKVNTSPVLSEFGVINGNPGTRDVFYVVALPDTPNAKADDPIFIDPPIDQLRVVYPGDFVAIDQLFGTQRWYAYPQQRFPKPDRTFLWDPNTSPVLGSGGKVDGVLAKPGTIMIPTKNFYIKEQQNWIDNYNYFHQGVGIMFDGQKWNNNVQAIIADKGSNIGEATWPLTLYFSDQVYESRLEQDHRYKFLINFGGGIENDLQGGPVFYDHGDSYSYSYKKKLEWYDENRVVQIDSAGGTVSVFFNPNDPAQSFAVGLNHFVDGNVTEWQETSVNDEGEEVVNNYKLSLSISTTLV
jgi:hypothetical protein